MGGRMGLSTTNRHGMTRNQTTSDEASDENLGSGVVGAGHVIVTYIQGSCQLPARRAYVVHVAGSGYHTHVSDMNLSTMYVPRHRVKYPPCRTITQRFPPMLVSKVTTLTNESAIIAVQSNTVVPTSRWGGIIIVSRQQLEIFI